MQIDLCPTKAISTFQSYKGFRTGCDSWAQLLNITNERLNEGIKQQKEARVDMAIFSLLLAGIVCYLFPKALSQAYSGVLDYFNDKKGGDEI